ncbi:hypothetical protein ACFLRN_04545 [Thermoproteota archaeon]
MNLEKKTLKNVTINEDRKLLEYFKKNVEDIKFVRKNSKMALELIKNEIKLTLQAEPLKLLWKSMIEDAIVYLKKKDKREKYNDDLALGTKKLYDFLNEFQKFEFLLYGAVEHYRDHLIHIFRVFLLGDYLVRESFGFDKIDVSDSVTISKEEKEAMWCIMALTHDLGYSLQGIFKINQSVRTILQQFGAVSVQELAHSYFLQFGNISDFALRFMSSNLISNSDGGFFVHLQPKYYQKFMHALSDFNHGIISSIILMKDLVFFRESDFMMDQLKALEPDDARQFMIRREIVRAIAAHSCDDIYHLKLTNFPFLLTLVDEMQEWGRPRLVDITKRGDAQTELIINEFDNKLIDYAVRFYFPSNGHLIDSEIQNVASEVANYFENKKNKWGNVLRSAVDGKHRNLILKFWTIDNSSKKIIKYYLEHENPEKVKIETFKDFEDKQSNGPNVFL